MRIASGNFTIRLPAEVRARLAQQAAADHRSLAGYVRLLLTQHLAGLPPSAEAQASGGASSKRNDEVAA